LERVEGGEKNQHLCGAMLCQIHVTIKQRNVGPII
jgi:hypothetical protein